MKKIIDWIKNYAYYYKIPIIIGVFVLVVGIICISQLVNKASVDCYVLYAGPKSFGATKIESIQSAFAKVTPDFNEDGEVNVIFTDITVMTGNQMEAQRQEAKQNDADYIMNGQYMSDMQEKFDLQISAGDAYICLLSPEQYKIHSGLGAYMKLEELGVNAKGAAYDECAIYFLQTEFAQAFGVFVDLPEDTLLVFRRKGALSEAKGKKEETKYERQLEVYKNVLAFEFEDK